MSTLILLLMDIIKKYEVELNQKNYYSFLMKVKTDLRKIIRKDEFEEYSKTIILALKTLTDLKEKESCLDLIKYFLDEFEKSFSKLKDISIYLLTFNRILEIIDPQNLDLKLHISNFVRIADKNNITNEDFIKYKVHYSITKYYQRNENHGYAYKYSLLTLDHELINNTLKDIFSYSTDISKLEQYFFICRTVLELLMRQKVQTAHEFIKLNMEMNYQNNYPLINFSYFLVVLIDKFASFDHFWFLINKYMPSIELDQNLINYLNKISISYFEKPIIEEKNNMLNNLMKLMSG